MKILELKVERKWKKDTYSIGNFYVNGVKWCNSLEDTDRGLKQDMPLEQIKKLKKYGETAIPLGRYKVHLSYSPKFKRITPILEDVPGYQYIRIHAGNTPKDTEGCILPGENTVKGKVLNSRNWENKITAEIKKYEETYITIL